MKLFSARFAKLTLCLSSLAVAQVSHADTSLLDLSAKMLSDLKSPSYTQATCVPYLTDLENKIDLTQKSLGSRDDLKAQSAAILDNLWQTRLALHDQVTAGASNECTHEIRVTAVKLRYLEDFLGEIGGNIQSVSADSIDYQSQVIPFLEDSSNYLTQKRDSTTPVLQEGDIVLARGVSFLSAMIAGIGDTETQFSHMIFVVKDPASGLLKTIESYVDDGVNFHEFKWAMKNGNSRLLVFRAKDQDLAKRAAVLMEKNVADRGEAGRIHYDYALDFTDHSTMSCPEVPQYALQMASNNQFNFPEKPSYLNHALNLLSALNIKPGATFTPGDLEGDSRFDMIAEYRDLRIMKDNRERDAIMTKALEWMDKDGAVLHQDLGSELAGGPLWSARHSLFWPFFSKVLRAPDFSAEIPRQMVRTVKLVTDMGTGTLIKLQAMDSAHLAQTGLSMTYNELCDAMETIKSEDEARYSNLKTRESSILVKYLRAN